MIRLEKISCCSIIYQASEMRQTFLGSSMAEHSAVNRRVVGSSPTWGAIGLDILAISSPFFVGNKVPYARLTPSFESGYLNEKHMQTTCIDKSP